MRAEAGRHGDIGRMQAWAGQSAGLARAVPALDLTRQIWNEAQSILV